MSADAIKIYQDHLDAVSDAFWRRDMTTVARMMHYPHVMRSRSLVQTVESEAELIEAAYIALTSMRRLGGTAYHRVCLDADFVPGKPDRIEGRHRVFLLRGGSYVIEPYESRMNLGRVNGEWLGFALCNENDIARITTLDPSRAKRIAP